jgi:mono/diheme cytochrome c family protein
MQPVARMKRSGMRGGFPARREPRISLRSIRATLLGLVLVCTSAEAQQFPEAQISNGAELYATYCVACHGWQMDYPGGSFDLRAFPSGQFARFANAVIKGKNNMPPWGDVFQPSDIEALWAYVMAGEKKK